MSNIYCGTFQPSIEAYLLHFMTLRPSTMMIKKPTPLEGKGSSRLGYPRDPVIFNENGQHVPNFSRISS